MSRVSFKPEKELPWVVVAGDEFCSYLSFVANIRSDTHRAHFPNIEGHGQRRLDGAFHAAMVLQALAWRTFPRAWFRPSDSQTPDWTTIRNDTSGKIGDKSWKYSAEPLPESPIDRYATDYVNHQAWPESFYVVGAGAVIRQAGLTEEEEKAAWIRFLQSRFAITSVIKKLPRWANTRGSAEDCWRFTNAEELDFPVKPKSATKVSELVQARKNWLAKSNVEEPTRSILYLSCSCHNFLRPPQYDGPHNNAIKDETSADLLNQLKSKAFERVVVRYRLNPTELKGSMSVVSTLLGATKDAGDSMVLLLALEDLRRLGVNISLDLSWERTLHDLLAFLMVVEPPAAVDERRSRWKKSELHPPAEEIAKQLRALVHKARFTVLTTGPSSAIIVDSQLRQCSLCAHPAESEKEFETRIDGFMSTYETLVASSIIYSLVHDAEYRLHEPEQARLPGMDQEASHMFRQIERGTLVGLLTARFAAVRGFSEFKSSVDKANFFKVLTEDIGALPASGDRRFYYPIDTYAEMIRNGFSNCDKLDPVSDKGHAVDCELLQTLTWIPVDIEPSLMPDMREVTRQLGIDQEQTRGLRLFRLSPEQIGEIRQTIIDRSTGDPSQPSLSGAQATEHTDVFKEFRRLAFNAEPFFDSAPRFSLFLRKVSREDISAITSLTDAGNQKVRGEKTLRDLALEIVRHGPEVIGEDPWRSPFAKIGQYVAIERKELRNLRECVAYLRKGARPDSATKANILVFGEPGSGKSFTIRQLRESSGSRHLGSLMEFNLTQFRDDTDLDQALSDVRNTFLREQRAPIVLWDEYDSNRGEREFGWIESLLDPSGARLYKGNPIGRSIFCFAGSRFRDATDFFLSWFWHRNDDIITFKEVNGLNAIDEIAGWKAVSERLALDTSQALPSEFVQLMKDLSMRRNKYDKFIAAKGMDLKRRIGCVLRVPGVNVSVESGLEPSGYDYIFTYLRRALLLRSQLQKFEALRLSSGQVSIDENVVLAFVEAESFRHGAGSFASLVNDSDLEGRDHFDASLLPSSAQMSYHVNVRSFERRTHPIRESVTPSKRRAGG